MSLNSRKAALLLHSMTGEDRQWALECLPSSAREAMQLLLAELSSLGIPTDTSLIRQVLDEASCGDDASHYFGVEGQEQCVRSASAVLLAGILRKESAWTTACLLAIESWPWEGAVLELLEPVLREEILRIRRGMESSPVPLPLRNALFEILGTRISSLNASPVDPPFEKPSGVLSRLWGRCFGRRGR